MDVKDRLRIILDYHGIKQSDFCKTIGVSNGYISAMRNGISFDKLSLIAKHYPQINIRVLLTGVIDPIRDTEYQRSGREVFMYNPYLDLEKLYGDKSEFQKQNEEIKSLKQIVAKQKRTIERLKNRLRK